MNFLNKKRIFSAVLAGAVCVGGYFGTFAVSNNFSDPIYNKYKVSGGDVFNLNDIVYMKKCFLGFPGYDVPNGYEEVTLFDIVYFKKLFLGIEEPEDIETTTEPITETITETVEPTTPNRPVFLTPEQIVELEKVEALNIDDETFEINYNKNGYVCRISGKYSDDLVIDIDSAVLSLYSIKNLLGVEVPVDEFAISQVINRKGGKTYRFNQVYHSVKVWSSSLSIVALDNGNVLSLYSDYKNVSGINTVPVLSENDAINLTNAISSELYIYSYDGYEDNPVLIYDCRTMKETILISAMDGSIIDRWSNVIIG